MAKKKTSQQPAPVKDKPQAPAQDQAQTAAPARVTTVSLTTCLVSVVHKINSLSLSFMDSRQAPAPRPQAAAPAQQPAQQQAAPQQQAKAGLSPELNSALLKLQEAVVKEPNKAENWIKLGNFQFDNQNPSAASTASRMPSRPSARRSASSPGTGTPCSIRASSFTTTSSAKTRPKPPGASCWPPIPTPTPLTGRPSRS